MVVKLTCQRHASSSLPHHYFRYHELSGFGLQPSDLHAKQYLNTHRSALCGANTTFSFAHATKSSVDGQ